MEDEDLQILRSEPSIDLLRRILSKQLPNNYREFEFINILIDNVVPIMEDLPALLAKQLVDIFSSLIGIENLINRVSLFKSQDQKLDAMVSLLNQVLEQDGILTKVITRRHQSDLQLKEIKSLFFGSKIFNCYTKLLDHNIKHSYSEMPSFSQKLTKELFQLIDSDFLEYNFLSTLLIGLLRFEGSKADLAMALLMSESYFSKYVSIYSHSKTNKHLLTTAIITYLSSITYKNRLNDELTRKIKNFEFTYKDFEKAVSLSNNKLLQAMVSSRTDSQILPLFSQALSVWGNSGYISRAPLSQQKHLTNLLIFLTRSLTVQDLQRISLQPLFLDSITNRISSTSDQVRSLGMLIGNLIFKSMEREPIFKMEEQLAFESEYTHDLDAELNSNQSLVGPLDQDVSIISKKIEKQVILDSDDDMDDAEDSDDDPTISDRSKPHNPLFLKELVMYLNADLKKDKHAYDKRRLALSHGSKLILRSTTKALRFYNESLISLYVGLNNEFEDKDFDDLRLKCLMSCCVRDPEEAPSILLRSFLGGDYSLQQRLTLLSALSLSARYLRGFDDLHFEVDETKILFPSKMLPPEIHKQFMGISNRLDLISASLETEIVNDAVDDTREELMKEGKVLRISSKLTKPKERTKTVLKARIPNFYKIVSSKFFFPITSVWFSINQDAIFNMGTFSGILASHFLKSIGLILHTAFPSATDLHDIVKESLTIVNTVTSAMLRVRSSKEEQKDDLLILNSILFIMLILLDNCSEQFLSNFFLSELLTFNTFIVGLLNDEADSLSSDQTLVLKAYTVSYRLNELFGKFEKSLVGLGTI